MAPNQNKKQDASGGRLFGDLVPYGDPSWYQGFASPYYNDTHRAFRAAVREFVQNELVPNAHEWDEAKCIPPEVFIKVAEAGILPGVMGGGWPSQYTHIKPAGGVKPEEFDAFHELIINDEFAKTGSGGVTWGIFGGLSIGLPPVYHFGRPELKKRIIPDILAGKKRICLAITEPAAGSDVSGLKTTATKTPDGKFYIVNGSKKWITNGVTADYFCTAVRTGGAAHGGVSLLLIERSPGVKTTQMQCQGVWSSGTTYVEFDNVKVPVENLIGVENQGFKVIMTNFNHERIGSASGAAGFSRTLVEESFLYAFKRKTFGKRLIEHPVIRMKLALMAAKVESLYAWLENLTYQTTQFSHEEGNEILGGPIALIKAHASLVMEFCAREASQIFGGLSYTRGGQGEKVERLYREVRAYAIPAGSEEIMFDLAIKQALRVQAANLKAKH